MYNELTNIDLGNVKNGNSKKTVRTLVEWAEPAKRVCEALQVEPDAGLPDEEVDRRRKKYGFNQLREHREKSIWQILYDQFKSLIILLLTIAAAISFLYNEIPEGWAILMVVAINTAIGFFTELRAVRSMEALLKLGKVKTRVRRDGTIFEVDAQELIPGDIILLEGGDVITADLRIIDSSKLQVNESTLTGESIPVEKKSEPVAEDTILAERSSMLYKGTAITRGSGVGVVTATGLNTELGKISSLVDEAIEEHTPLEERLDKLGYRLIALTLLIAVLVSITGIIRGNEVFLMIETGIALAVASIPEGLPIVATIALARGMRIMAAKNALINRLSSVETLGATSIIFTDKTGTLTENRMTVNRLILPEKGVHVNNHFSIQVEGGNENIITPGDDTDLQRALETAVFCTNASIDDQNINEGSGDPLEVALLVVGKKAGLDHQILLETCPEVREEAFDPEIKMMATWNAMGDVYRVSVKGAPGTVLKNCDHYLQRGKEIPLDEHQVEKWLQINNRYASEGHRLVALAYKVSDTQEGNPYDKLVFQGFVVLLDPARKEVKPAILKCKEAGIRVIMVTGDQSETARYIAKSVGLIDDENPVIIHGKDLAQLSNGNNKALFDANIFVRISPQQKLDLIKLYQKKGYIVAMTGDGVNDAPALKKANIGIAMGKRGTQVAKEASHMVLTDDSFSTIVTAVEQGRVIFSNIRRFIYYLLSCNISEVFVVAISMLFGSVLALLPLQILFLNLVTDVFPALALGISAGEPGIMKNNPRSPDEPIMSRKDWIGVTGYGLVITGAVLGGLLIAISVLGLESTEAVTISFLTLALAQLWHVFNMHSSDAGLIDNAVVKNFWVWGALILCLFITLAAVYIPAIASVLKITPPDFYGWIVIMGMSLIPLIYGELINSIKKRKQ